MIELVLVVCLRQSPAACEERSMLGMHDVSAMACMMQAQAQIAQWSQAHPDLTVARWSCRDAARREVRA